MNITLTNNELSLDDESENSNHDKGLNDMSFAFVVKIEPVEVNERDEDIEHSDYLEERSEDDRHK